MNEAILREEMMTIFNHLHENPEVSWQEEQTTAYLYDFLQKQGLKPVQFEGMTGLYVDIGPGQPKVGFRTDIDALWQEVNGEYQANHSCGHDGHMTVALGVVRLLKEVENDLASAVRIIFQPAEEKGQGAKAMIEKGVIDPLVYLFGMHVRPLLEIEDGKYAAGIQHGAARLLTGEIKGLEAHGARPETGVNAIEVASAIVEGLKRIWLSPTETASIKMTQIDAGSAANIIPGKATFSIDARAQKNDIMDKLTAAFEQIVSSVATLYDVDIDYEVAANIVAAEIDDSAHEIMQQAIESVAGADTCIPTIMTPGGEDFHFYTYDKRQLKATMLGLGCGVTPGLHHPNMTFNRERLISGAYIVKEALQLAMKKVEEG